MLRNIENEIDHIHEWPEPHSKSIHDPETRLRKNENEIDHLHV
jgi:hypothetical protein